MPEISRFLGVSIRMFRDDHPPPHFHAVYNEFAAQISIARPAILEGRLPPRILARIFHEFRQPEGVAQASSLLYRGFPIRRCDQATLQPADWKSAIQQVGNLRYTASGARFRS